MNSYDGKACIMLSTTIFSIPINTCMFSLFVCLSIYFKRGHSNVSKIASLELSWDECPVLPLDKQRQ